MSSFTAAAAAQHQINMLDQIKHRWYLSGLKWTDMQYLTLALKEYLLVSIGLWSLSSDSHNIPDEEGMLIKMLTWSSKTVQLSPFAQSNQHNKQLRIYSQAFLLYTAWKKHFTICMFLVCKNSLFFLDSRVESVKDVVKMQQRFS